MRKLAKRQTVPQDTLHICRNRYSSSVLSSHSILHKLLILLSVYVRLPLGLLGLSQISLRNTTMAYSHPLIRALAKKSLQMISMISRSSQTMDMSFLCFQKMVSKFREDPPASIVTLNPTASWSISSRLKTCSQMTSTNSSMKILAP
jgi:hypothetical protein